MNKSNLFIQTLKKNSYSVTKPRRAVFAVLEKNEALSMKQIAELVGGTIDRTSVYRTIELFEKLGIVHRIHIGWKYKVELSERYSHHHHHAACTNCGGITVFEENAQLENDIHALAQKLGFTLENHTLELRGTCPNCQKQAKA